MLKKSLILVFIISVLIAIYSSHHVISNSNGAPPGYTGSPFDGNNCSVCHAHKDSTIGNVNWISTDIPVNGYNHSSIYNITVTIPGGGLKGFEISPQDINGNLVGTFISGTNSQIIGSEKYITHSSPGNQNPNIWTFQWMPSMPGAGSFTFYGAYTVDTNNTFLESIAVPEENCIDCHGGISDFQKNNKNFMTLYSKEGLVLLWNSLNESKVIISIYSISGRLISCNNNFYQHNGKNQFKINTNNFTDGVYLVTINDQHSVLFSKFLITK